MIHRLVSSAAQRQSASEALPLLAATLRTSALNLQATDPSGQGADTKDAASNATSAAGKPSSHVKQAGSASASAPAQPPASPVGLPTTRGPEKTAADQSPRVKSGQPAAPGSSSVAAGSSGKQDASVKAGAPKSTAMKAQVNAARDQIEANYQRSKSFQNVAALTYQRVEQFEHAARHPDAAEKELLQKVSSLDAANQQKLKERAAAVIPAPPAPGLAVWAAGAVAYELQELIKATPEQQLASQYWYAGAVAAARQTLLQKEQAGTPYSALMQAAAGKAAALSDKQVLQEFVKAGGSLTLDWESLLTLPQLPDLLHATCSSNAALASSLQVCGLHPLQLAPLAAHDEPVPAASTSASSQQQQASADVTSLLAAAYQASASLRVEGQQAAADVADALSAALQRQLGAADASPHMTLAQHLLGLSLSTAPNTAADTISPSTSASTPVAKAAPATAKDNKAAAPSSTSPSSKEAAVAGCDASTIAAAAQYLSAQGKASAADADGVLAALLQAGSSTDAAACAKVAMAVAGCKKSALLSGHVAVLARAQPGDLEGLGHEEFRRVWGVVAQLDAIGRPLEQALLGGALSMEQVRGLSWQARNALLWRLHSSGQLSAGRASLLAALYKSVAAGHEAAAADASGGVGAELLLQLERDLAELDITQDEFIALPSEAAGPVMPLLPHDDDIAAAVARLPPADLARYNAYYSTAPDGGPPGGGYVTGGAGGEAAQMELSAALDRALEAATTGGVSGLDLLSGEGGLAEWVGQAKAAVRDMPASSLSLLSRFLELKLRPSLADAQASQTKLRLLLAAVATELRAATTTSSSGAGEVAEAGSMPNAWWRSLQGPSQESSYAGTSSPPHDVLVDLLGAAGAAEFVAWEQAQALIAARAGAAGQPSGASPGSWGELEQPYELLAEQHAAMDVDRYLQMAHDPRLHVALSPREAPVGWRDARLHGSEAAWLDAARQQLDTYLMAMGMRPLLGAEWCVYKEAALQEWGQKRAAAEEARTAHGHSNFYNARAEEVYLQQLLVAGVPPASPLHQQAQRYLSTINANPSWTFAQRRHAVQRLVELSEHLMKQPPRSKHGSPFAPLFEPGGPDLTPRLAARPPPIKGAVAAATPGGTASVPKLPTGF